MSDKPYQPSSDSDSEPELCSTPGPALRSSQRSLESISSGVSEMSPGSPPTPSCTQGIKHFSFREPKKRTEKPKHSPFQYLKHKRKGFKGTPAWKKGTQSQSPPHSSSPELPQAAKKLFFRTPTPKSIEKLTFRTKKYDEVTATASQPVGSCILDYEVLKMMLSMTVCRECLAGEMSVLDTGSRAGAATHILLTCNTCKMSQYFWTVSGKFGAKIQVGSSEIAKRNKLVYSSVLGGRLLGIGHAKLSLYHSMLDIPSPCSVRNYSKVQNDLIIVAEMVAEYSMKQAGEELRRLLDVQSTDPFVRTVVSFDGAYQTRGGKTSGGFSRYCFGGAIASLNSKVVAYGIASNSCKMCVQYNNLRRNGKISEEEHTTWKSKHEDSCPAKYQDYASVQLESALAPSIVVQAMNRGILFSGMVTDGDNKTSEILNKQDLYSHLGDEKIERLECLSHVAKRMKINLVKRQEKVLKTAKFKKAGAKQFYEEELQLSKKELTKKLGEFRGKVRRDATKRTEWDELPSKAIRTISDAVAGQVASYYRIAVKRNVGDIPAIQSAIKAISLHLGANNENAEENHQHCPQGEDSWCQYNSQIAKGKPPPNHPNFLSEEAVTLIDDVFHDFGYNSCDFLEKIQGGRTSNHNEALHSKLWGMVPKTEPASYDNMRLGSALAVIRYNEGYSGILKICEIIGATSPHMLDCFSELNKHRVDRSHLIPQAQKKRFAKKQLRGQKVAKQLKKHGEGYSSGKFTAEKSADKSSESDTDREDEPANLPPSDLPTSSNEAPSDLPTSSNEAPSDLPFSSNDPPSDLPFSSKEPPSDLPTSSNQPEEDFCALCFGTDENCLLE